MSDQTVIVTEDSPHLITTPGGVGPSGKGLEFDITGDTIGVRVEGEAAFTYTDPLTGPQGTTAYGDLTGVPSTFPPQSHTHPISVVTGLQSALNDKAAQSALGAKQSTSEKGTANGYAGLDGSGLVPESQIPDPDILPSSSSAIGSLIVAGSTDLSDDTEYMPGKTVSGSSLTYSNNSGDSEGHPLSTMGYREVYIAGYTEAFFNLSGTWRLLSRVHEGKNGTRTVGLWQRIS